MRRPGHDVIAEEHWHRRLFTVRCPAMRGSALWAATLSAACLTAPVKNVNVPAAAPVVQVPPGCLDDLSGAWEHADDPSWTYQAIDDGGEWTLEAQRRPLDGGPPRRRFSRDGGLPWVSGPADAGDGASMGRSAPPAPQPRLSLLRTPDGFRGVSAFTAFGHDAGCVVEDPVQVTSCEGGRVQLEAVITLRLGRGCARVDGGALGTTQVLRRVTGSRDDGPDDTSRRADAAVADGG